MASSLRNRGDVYATVSVSILRFTRANPASVFGVLFVVSAKTEKTKEHANQSINHRVLLSIFQISRGVNPTFCHLSIKDPLDFPGSHQIAQRW